jgi:hypothetical protein
VLIDDDMIIHMHIYVYIHNADLECPAWMLNTEWVDIHKQYNNNSSKNDKHDRSLQGNFLFAMLC